MVDYVNLDYTPKETDLIAMYYVERAPEACPNIEQACEEIAKESSIGTWTEIITMSEDIAKRLRPSAFSINKEKNIVKIAYTQELFEAGNMSQILSAIAGNIYGMKALKNLRLLDVSFPRDIIKAYRGPKFGIQGIKNLTKVTNRPLLGTIVKPKVGLNEKEHAQVCGQAWKGGLDIVKDDENLTSMTFNKFEKRIEETLKIRDKLENETGEKKIYMPNITAPVSTMKERADFVIECGGEYIMIDILTIGFSAVQEIREYLDDKNVVIHAHRAMHAALTRNKKHGMTMLSLAKIMRLIGVDQLHTGTVVGKMEGGKREVLEINKAITGSNFLGNDETLLDQNWANMKPILPVASGGLSPLDIPELIEILGKEMVFQFGGGCHGHPEGTESGAKAIRQAVDALLGGYKLEEYAKKHSELQKALDKWSKK
ncbi:MAG: type III ribulose-bisphosphate carboxylase [Candidatus Lokiarchaeota archaeon]|nr:type III ribulose-bisphosphate carboxylase [Candidatus Lokiarchaeota archaeon]MBD3340563.1 type III ribulose-bisphosphate carboxylase [Candidatus Lokiarchaeota archaeon]